MLHRISSPQHLVPYLMFAAAWAFLCGLIIASMPAHGQSNSASADAAGNVTIEAPRNSAGQTPEPGVIYAPPLGEVYTLSQTVNHADLDLSKASDFAEFQKRVNVTAKDICRKLSSRYPRTLHDNFNSRDCVKNAVAQAMAAAKRPSTPAG